MPTSPSSTFTGNNAGGPTAESDGASTSQLPGPVGRPRHRGRQRDTARRSACPRVAASLSVPASVTAEEISEGRRPGHRFHLHRQRRRLRRLLPRRRTAASTPVDGATVSEVPFGDPSDPENGSNAAGCFTACGAHGRWLLQRRHHQRRHLDLRLQRRRLPVRLRGRGRRVLRRQRAHGDVGRCGRRPAGRVRARHSPTTVRSTSCRAPSRSTRPAATPTSAPAAVAASSPPAARPSV